MKIFAALGAGVCLLAIPASSALANPSHGSNSLPGLPTLNSPPGHGGWGSGPSHSSGPSSPNVHHADWRGHDWGWLKHRIVNYCRNGHGWGHGGFGWDTDDNWGGGDRDHDRCHPHHPTSP